MSKVGEEGYIYNIVLGEDGFEFISWRVPGNAGICLRTAIHHAIDVVWLEQLNEFVGINPNVSVCVDGWFLFHDGLYEGLQH